MLKSSPGAWYLDVVGIRESILSWESYYGEPIGRPTRHPFISKLDIKARDSRLPSAIHPGQDSLSFLFFDHMDPSYLQCEKMRDPSLLPALESLFARLEERPFGPDRIEGVVLDLIFNWQRARLS